MPSNTKSSVQRFILLSLIFSIVLAMSTLPASAVDALDMQLFKGMVFTQTTNGAPAIATNSPYIFQAVAGQIYPGSMTNASVETPALTTDPMPFTTQTNFAFTAGAASQSALDTAYGAGTYNISYTGVDDGQTSVPISLGADDFPPAPVVSNIVAAQSVLATNGFTVTFAPETNTNDFVQMTVVDTNDNPVFETPSIYFSEGLSATNTAIAIPTYALAPGAIYTAMLEFVRLSALDLDTLPITEAGFFTETAFSIQTEGASGGGSQTNVPPAAPLAPGFFNGSVLTLTIANGSGSFAASGMYQLFTSPMGNNYVILGPAGKGLSSGTYAYTVTGTNSATMTFADSQLGAGITLQILFDASGAGFYTITSASAGSQSGVFDNATNYTTVTTSDLYLPAITNGFFQSYFSGQFGASYTLQTSSNITLWSNLTNFSLANLATNVTAATATHGLFYRTRLNSITFAPASVAGDTFNLSITGGAAPLTNNGIFQFLTATNGDSYQIAGGPGTGNGAGSYSYTVTGSQTATVSYTDSTTSVTCAARLFFTSPQAGFFYLTQSDSSAFQSGSFNLSQGVVLFLGNVKFTPDAQRAGSVLFPADGATPMSLSVTDVVGYVWTLHIPADALQTPTTISMTPFASVDSSASPMAVSSGVQLSPEGTQFQDGLLLTVTAPAPLSGSHVTLSMADGHGANMYYVATSNQANSYSTTLFHFSSSALGNIDPPPPGGTLGAAFQSAVAAIQQLETQLVPCPPPPDDGFSCNDQNDTSVNAYASSLFAPETAAAQQLLAADAAYIAAIGSDPYAAQLHPLILGLIESSCYRKVDFLFTYYNTQPLKFLAVAQAANYVSSLDKQNGGVGRPDWTAQLKQWLSESVVNYYLNNLKSKHDYTAATAVNPLINAFGLFSLDPSPMIQQFANALTFQVTINLSINGTTGAGGGPFVLSAQGAIQVTGGSTADTLFPLTGSDSVNYTAGVASVDTLQLPLSYPQRVCLTFDPCAETSYLYLGDVGAEVETWDNPPNCDGCAGPTFTATYLSDGFESAFFDQNEDPDDQFDCTYRFPMEFENLEAVPINITLSGFGPGLCVDHRPV